MHKTYLEHRHEYFTQVTINRLLENEVDLRSAELVEVRLSVTSGFELEDPFWLRVYDDLRYALKTIHNDDATKPIELPISHCQALNSLEEVIRWKVLPGESKLLVEPLVDKRYWEVLPKCLEVLYLGEQRIFHGFEAHTYLKYVVQTWHNDVW